MGKNCPQDSIISSWSTHNTWGLWVQFKIRFEWGHSWTMSPIFCSWEILFNPQGPPHCYLLSRILQVPQAEVIMIQSWLAPWPHLLPLYPLLLCSSHASFPAVAITGQTSTSLRPFAPADPSAWNALLPNCLPKPFTNVMPLLNVLHSLFNTLHP